MKKLADQQDAGGNHTATLPAQLMAKPAMTWEEFWTGILGLPDSTAEQLVREPDAPRFFLLGRRRYIRTADACAWIDRRAEAVPYFPRSNKRAST